MSTETEAALAGPRAFDPGGRWRIHPQVAVRPEPFGALLYHFGTRRLTFLKDRRLLEAVRALADQPTALAACEVAGIEETDRPRYIAALGRLATIDMIVREDAKEPDV